MNNEYHAETALRVLFGFLVREAVKYDRGIEPLFCFAREHYVRVHARLVRGAGAADRSVARIGYVMQCPACPYRSEQAGILPGPMTCPHCSSGLVPIGPLWTGHLQDMDLLEKIEAAIPRFTLGNAAQLRQLVVTCRGELSTSFHYDYHVLSRHFRISPPPIEQVIESLVTRGYSASRAHYHGTALKTDAPLDVIRGALMTRAMADEPHLR